MEFNPTYQNKNNRKQEILVARAMIHLVRGAFELNSIK